MIKFNIEFNTFFRLNVFKECDLLQSQTCIIYKLRKSLDMFTFNHQQISLAFSGTVVYECSF